MSVDAIKSSVQYTPHTSSILPLSRKTGDAKVTLASHSNTESITHLRCTYLMVYGDRFYAKAAPAEQILKERFSLASLCVQPYAGLLSYSAL